MSEIIGSYTVEEDEERLDRIARALYGSEHGGTVEALYEANPGLAEHGVLIPRGTTLRVPAPPPSPAGLVRPWE